MSKEPISFINTKKDDPVSHAAKICFLLERIKGKRTTDEVLLSSARGIDEENVGEVQDLVDMMFASAGLVRPE